MRALLLAGVAALWIAGPGMDDPGSIYTAVLSRYVRDGRVDYAGLVEDTRLDLYVEYLARTQPRELPRESDRLAFWINAYNAYTLKLIRDNYPVSSINDLHTGGRVIGHIIGKTAWDRSFAVVGGVTYTLNDIEHEMIRPTFSDARVHFALVCAAVSCPPLRAQAYAGDSLDTQLDDQGRIFFADSTKNNFVVETRTAHLSRILDWYSGDFGKSDAEVMGAIAPYVGETVRASILSDPGAWKIKYNEYDWNLND